MKKIYLLLVSAMVLFTACHDDDTTEIYRVIPVSVQLDYPSTADIASKENVSVQVTSSSGVVYTELTNADGVAAFELPLGLYEIMATDRKTEAGKSKVYTGSLISFPVTDQESITATLSLLESEMSQIIIKELYSGGCLANDGVTKYQYDKYVVLYNNSDEPAQLQNVCIAMVLPYNATVNNGDVVNGSLFYEGEGWVPAGLGYFYFQNSTILQPREQLVVVINNANDNTATYTNSVDLGKSEYYVAYAPEAYTNVSYHPAPSANIPTSQYLSGNRYGTGNAWTLSVTSPAFFLFAPEGTTPEAFYADADNINGYNGSTTQLRKKVPMNWVIDAVEVFAYGASNNVKRFPATIDAGSVAMTNYQGYTIYRNVDKEATEAIADNTGRLVYSYSLGTVDQNGTTDPSGIDAEASVRNGAKIVYLDTNNSSNDFHQRAISSLK